MVRKVKVSILVIFVASIFMVTFTVYAAKTVTLYSQDGRKIYNVPEEKIAEYGSGWYTEDPNIKKVTLYSDDGRVIENVPEDKVSAYGPGWHIRTYVTLYSDDGRTIDNVGIDQVKDYGEGWYIREYVTLYSEDGRTIDNVPKDKIATYGSGWYTEKPTLVFRNISWGMTKDEVNQAEDNKTKILNNGLILKDIYIGGLNGSLYYLFNDEGKLYRIGFYSDEKHSNDNDYLNDYSKLKSALTEKYGTPKYETDTIWKNDLFKGDYESWGLAISAGHLVCTNAWSTQDSDVGLILDGDNYKINLKFILFSKTISAPKKSNGM